MAFHSLAARAVLHDRLARPLVLALDVDRQQVELLDVARLEEGRTQEEVAVEHEVELKLERVRQVLEVDAHVTARAVATAAVGEAPALPSRNSRLAHLGLERNAIGDEGLKALGPPLRQLPALKEVYLYSIQIGDEGVQANFYNRSGPGPFRPGSDKKVERTFRELERAIRRECE